MNNKQEMILSGKFQDNNFKTIELKMQQADEFVGYEVATQYRMMKAWNLFVGNETYKSDFECAARDYLIVNHSALTIPNYRLSNYASEYGLQFDNKTKTLTSSHSYPSELKHIFLNAVFMQGEASSLKESKVNLETNAFIRKLTGFTEYKSEEQKLSVIASLKAPDGFTTLVSMSTGGGKSLITQAVAFQKQGLTLVFVPTVSLMLDQVRNIKNKGENEILFYNASSNNLAQIEMAIKRHEARMLFMSPEALIRNVKLHDLIFNANEDGYLKNIVIDEAHMVMEWGSLFRVDFQCLDIVRKQLLIKNSKLRTYLLSATFSEETVKLLRKTYSENNKWLEIRCDKLRREPRFSFIRVSEFDKLNKAIELICKLPHPMIVYVQTPRDAEQLLRALRDRVGLYNVKTFTGQTSSEERQKLIDAWAKDEFTIMIATCAFGVGVDKKDVRTVLNLYVPENANSYYQQAGRGGRDGLPCLSVILYSDEDLQKAFNYIQKVLTTEKLSKRWFSMLDHAKRIGSNKFVIDTTTKPSYRDEDDFLEFWANDGDVTWNVFVILFLKRCGLLQVDWMQYNEKTKFVFDITLLEPALRQDEKQAQIILEKYRQEEAERNLDSFKKFRNALQKANHQCIASLFNEIYGRTDEYCAGCNAHDDVFDGQDNSFPKVALNLMIETSNVRIKKLFGNAMGKLVLGKDMQRKGIDSLSKLGVNAFVGPVDVKYFLTDLGHKDSVIAFSYQEFLDHAGNGRMFLSGCVGVLLPVQELGLLLKILSVCGRLSTEYGVLFVYFAEENVFVRQKGKWLNELIEGPCVQEYVFEEECRNV